MNRSDFGGPLKRKKNWKKRLGETGERTKRNEGESEWERKQDREQSVPSHTARQTHINSANILLPFEVRPLFYTDG